MDPVLAWLIGLLPFVLLYQIPRTLDLPPVLSEEVSSISFIVIPLACAVAIIKFKLMHIELVINRSLVYAFLTILLVSLYLLSMEMFRLLFARVVTESSTAPFPGRHDRRGRRFRPAQNRIQSFVDKTSSATGLRRARQAALKFQRARSAGRRI